MKKHYLYAIAAAGLLSTACSKDDVPQPSMSGGVSEIDQTLYVSMSIAGDPSDTRAASADGNPVEDLENPTKDDFATGTENDVNNAYFVFYDDDGMVVGDIVPVTLGDADESVVGGTIEKSYKSVVSVDVRKGEKLPTSVICYLNPISPSTLSVPLSTIQTVTRQQVYTTDAGKRYFAMSNSVYYDKNPGAAAPAANSNPSIAVEVPKASLYSSETAAQAALDAPASDPESNNVVTIHVERYATKLKFSEGPVDTYKTATRVYDPEETSGYTVKNIDLTFVPQFWALNAQANDTYVIKSFRQSSTDGQPLPDNYTYADLDKFININDPADYPTPTTPLLSGKWEWNNADYHRSYWAMSPSYFQDEYPEVSADLDDIDDIKQKYVSYTELSNATANYGKAHDDDNWHYFRETTVGSPALGSANPAAAVASVIYVGKYELSLNGTKLADETPFYTYIGGPVQGVDGDRPYVYFDNNAGSATSKVAGGESMLKRFFVQSTVLYKKVTDDNGDDSYTRLNWRDADDLALLTAALEVSEISDDVKTLADGNPNTKLKLQANTRSLQFKSNATTAGSKIYIVTGNGYNEIVANGITPATGQVTVNQANAILMRQVGYAYYYNLGHAYFNIPVKHLGWYRGGNDNKNAERLDWTKVRVGDFGMVRNHQYTVNVNKVTGLAEGIGSDDTPIVPPTAPDKYFVAYSVNILRWAIVPDQNVDL